MTGAKIVSKHVDLSVLEDYFLICVGLRDFGGNLFLPWWHVNNRVLNSLEVVKFQCI